MNPDVFVAFLVAAWIILVIPGPTILLVVSKAITHGRAATVPLVLGVLFGDFTALTFSLLGLGAVLSTSATLFNALKWAGAAYLVYLALKMWRDDPQADEQTLAANAKSSWSLFQSAYIVTALNPKSIAFFIAFLPQFVDPTKSTTTQFVIMGSAFLIMATVNAALYAVFAGQLHDTMRRPRVRRWFQRLGAGALIGAAGFMVGMRR